MRDEAKGSRLKLIANPQNNKFKYGPDTSAHVGHVRRRAAGRVPRGRASPSQRRGRRRGAGCDGGLVTRQLQGGRRGGRAYSRTGWGCQRGAQPHGGVAAKGRAHDAPRRLQPPP